MRIATNKLRRTQNKKLTFVNNFISNQRRKKETKKCRRLEGAGWL